MRFFVVLLFGLFHHTAFAEGKDQIDLGNALFIAQTDLKESETRINRSFALDAISDADLPPIGFKRDVRQVLIFNEDGRLEN